MDEVCKDKALYNYVLSYMVNIKSKTHFWYCLFDQVEVTSFYTKNILFVGIPLLHKIIIPLSHQHFNLFTMIKQYFYVEYFWFPSDLSTF